MTDREFCHCGSGLRRVRCCGLDVFGLSPIDAMAPLAPLLVQAETALAEGRQQDAAAHFHQLLELAPGHESGLLGLYQLHRQQKNLTAAETLIRRVVGIYPNNFWATNELTLMLLGKGAVAEAETHARNAIRISPLNAQAHNLMGMVMTEANQPFVGEYHYRRVLDLGGKQPITLANLAWNLKNQGRMEEARSCYQQSFDMNPDIFQTLLGWAKLEEADRQLDAALALLDRAQLLLPDSPSVQLTRATVLARQKKTKEALEILDENDSGQFKVKLGPAELLEKGRLLDRLGRFDEAFATFNTARKLALEMGAPAYMASVAADFALRLKGFFTEKRMAILPRGELRRDMPQPIFIVGFPRSGTTLIEQTISVHEQISAGDELPYINDITRVMPRLLTSPLNYPEALAELWMGDHRDGLNELRDYYLNHAAQSGIFRERAAWFTDKMPLNETNLGLISLMFPQSPVIHVIRHPLDVVLSVYSNQLTHGFYCAAQLETIAQHFMLVFDLVQHYRKTLTLHYIAVRYEDMVAHQANTIRNILDFVGLDFDQRCLHFETNTRYARTASYAQVTEKLYDSSRYRYRSYLRHLAPVLDTLRPVIEHLGYSIDC